jgi:hypothetical protein
MAHISLTLSGGFCPRSPRRLLRMVGGSTLVLINCSDIKLFSSQGRLLTHKRHRNLCLVDYIVAARVAAPLAPCSRGPRCSRAVASVISPVGDASSLAPFSLARTDIRQRVAMRHRLTRPASDIFLECVNAPNGRRLYATPRSRLWWKRSTPKCWMSKPYLRFGARSRPF